MAGGRGASPQRCENAERSIVSYITECGGLALRSQVLQRVSGRMNAAGLDEFLDENEDTIRSAKLVRRRQRRMERVTAIYYPEIWGEIEPGSSLSDFGKF